MQGHIDFSLHLLIYLIPIFELFSYFIDFEELVDSKNHPHHFKLVIFIFLISFALFYFPQVALRYQSLHFYYR